jgi:hypothetical protein
VTTHPRARVRMFCWQHVQQAWESDGLSKGHCQPMHGCLHLVCVVGYTECRQSLLLWQRGVL